MANLLDYIDWRGDLSFTQAPYNAIDALLFSAFAYIRLEGIVDYTMKNALTMESAARLILERKDAKDLVRTEEDLILLEKIKKHARFAPQRLVCYQTKFIPSQETQFAAVGIMLDDGSATLAFRGTDSTITGWKEDFNMSFQDSVPSQLEATRYTQEFTKMFSGPLRLCGHSKGGNLAVFAAAKAGKAVQKRITAVYNHDGPGFTQYLLNDKGYLHMLPRIHTYVPQSSIIGLLLEHEDPYTIIKSDQISILQHEPYSWEVLGNDFIRMKEITPDSRLVNETIKTWLMDMNKQERNAFVDALFDLLAAGDADHTNEILQPRNLYAYLRTLGTNDEMRRLLSSQLADLLRTASEILRKDKEEIKKDHQEKTQPI